MGRKPLEQPVYYKHKSTRMHSYFAYYGEKLWWRSRHTNRWVQLNWVDFRNLIEISKADCPFSTQFDRYVRYKLPLLRKGSNLGKKTAGDNVLLGRGRLKV